LPNARLIELEGFGHVPLDPVISAHADEPRPVVEHEGLPLAPAEVWRPHDHRRRILHRCFDLDLTFPRLPLQMLPPPPTIELAARKTRHGKAGSLRVRIFWLYLHPWLLSGAWRPHLLPFTSRATRALLLSMRWSRTITRSSSASTTTATSGSTAPGAPSSAR